VGVVELVDCIESGHPGADPDEVEYLWVLAKPRVFVRTPSLTSAGRGCSWSRTKWWLPHWRRRGRRRRRGGEATGRIDRPLGRRNS